uniref:NB-ARC domain-containing protein n=2 Tax=Oryza glumipatula TaxID=40148 RepID=A0A0E0ACF2_9ORYZ
MPLMKKSFPSEIDPLIHLKIKQLHRADGVAGAGHPSLHSPTPTPSLRPSSPVRRRRRLSPAAQPRTSLEERLLEERARPGGGGGDFRPVRVDLLSSFMVGFGEMIASAVIKELSGKLSSPIWNTIMSQVNFKQDLEAIKSMLGSLQAKLNDAERQSQKKESVHDLLKKLKAVAYDIEDRLVAYESISNDGDGSLRHDNWSSFSDKLKSRYNLQGDMKKMRKRLEEIKKEMDLTNFRVDGASDEQDWINSRHSEARLNDSDDIVGRIMEKRRIMDLLLSDEEHSIISIYGLGGLGKTTLAQMVFNDSTTQTAFEMLAWVYVSKKFDLDAIRSSIIQQYNERFQYGNAGIRNVSTESILAEKRSLIVLDDLWEEDNFELEKLKKMLRDGRVIVTTRSKKVAERMNKDLQIELGLLPNEDCWTLFRKRALASTTVHPYMEEIGKNIVKKCQGLPLAVKSLGYLLGHLEPNLWEEILLSDIWAEDDGRFSDNKVLPSLKLSYYNMPSYLRLCFAYCSVFPKGSHIQRSSLIQQWIALGFIQPPRFIVAENYAEDCLRELIGMSFLQNVDMSTAMSSRYTGSQSVLKMHDLVHDLASVVASDEVCIFHASGTELGKRKGYCRYMFLLNFSELSQAPILPHTARALHFKDCRKFPKALSRTKFLRILDFNACTIDTLPDSISQLRLLKYLSVSGMKTAQLPKLLSKLHDLQALTLSKNTDIVELPSCICEFLKLHYLDLHGCSNLEELPEDIHKLKELQHLNLSDCSSLKSLPSFSSLSGGLQKLSFLNVSHFSQLQKLPDNYLPNMINLNMAFCPKLRALPSGLFMHMKKLLFLNFSGCTSLMVLPEFGDDGTGCLLLQVLDLSGCANLLVLPASSTKLSELRCLNLSGCSHLQNFLKLIPHWKFGKLEYLNLSGVGTKSDSEAPGSSAGEIGSLQDHNKELELGMLQENIITQGLFRLKYLSVGGFTLYSEQGIARMADLLTLPNFDVRRQDGGICSNILIIQQILELTHRELNIKCLQNVVSSEEAKQLELEKKQQFHSLSFEWSLSGTGSSVEDEHRAKPSAVLDNLRPHRYLQSLSIKGYTCTVFPDWIDNISDTLPNLVKLILSDIEGCDYIPALGHLPNLQELEINNIPRLHDARIGPCKKLRRLTLVALPNEATILLFYGISMHTEVQMMESSHGCDEEVRETGQEFNTFPDSLPENQVIRNPSDTHCGGPSRKSKILEFKGWFKALRFHTSGETRENETLASALSHISPVPEDNLLSPKLSRGCLGVTSAVFPGLDYLMIERCNNLKLHPNFPKSKEYFIKYSSLSPALDYEDTSNFPTQPKGPYGCYTEGCSQPGQGTLTPLHEDAMQQSIPRLKSKMYIEGSSGEHFHKWIGLISTHLDELVITDCSARCLFNLRKLIRDFPEKHEQAIRTRKHNSMENIYGLSQSCIAKLKKLSMRLPSNNQYERRSTGVMMEDLMDRHVCQVAYINIGTVDFFSVEPIEGGIFCSSNISLLYKHHDVRSSRLVVKNLENVKRPDEAQELANYQQLRSVSLLWSRRDLTQDLSMTQDKGVLQNLRPNQDLETLHIEGFGGDEFCSWMMNVNSFLPNLVTVKLSNMEKCQRLPSLGQLANLEVLHISDMPSVREVDHHVYGDEILFRKLRELRLSRMDNLEEWPTATLMAAQDDHQFSQGDGNFPNLQVLAIVDCPRMRFVPAFPGSQECTLVKSSSILASFKRFITNTNLALMTLKINDCGASAYIGKFLQGSVNLEHLTIDSFIDLNSLPEPMRECRSLKKLFITNCWNLSALPEWLGELMSLRMLEVQATKLKSLPQSIQCLTALEWLILAKCNYKLRARCTSGEDKDKIKHINIVETTQVPLMNLNSSDMTLLQQVTSSQFIDLHIGGLEQEIDLKEADTLELQTKMELSSLSLNWSYASAERGMQNKAVFEKLQPHDGLEILCIKNYAGIDFPRWMSSLRNLLKLEMDGTEFEHLHLDQLHNLRVMYLSNVKFGKLHLDRLQNLIELYLFRVRFENLLLDQLHSLREMCLSCVEFGRLHFDQLQNLRQLNLTSMKFEYVLLNQLHSLEELHLSQISSLQSNQSACIECTEPLWKLQRIVMSKIKDQELKISMQGRESDENLFPSLQHFETELCENLRFRPSIPRSTHYIISDRADLKPLTPRVHFFPSFKKVMGLSAPGSTSKMEIKNIESLSFQTPQLRHLKLLDITELTIYNCVDSCPLPECILCWKSLRKIQILRCKNIYSLPEWFGEMASLSELVMETYTMRTLNPCIQRLTNLQTLTLSECTKKLKERCSKSGDDWMKIKHIPYIQITEGDGC